MQLLIDSNKELRDLVPKQSERKQSEINENEKMNVELRSESEGVQNNTVDARR